MDLQNLLRTYLDEAKIMQLATIGGGKPWVCSLNYAMDNDWNLYWMSVRSSQHSQQIRTSPAVAGAIVKNPAIVQGVQFEGMAYEAEGKVVQEAHDAFSKKYGTHPERLLEARSTDLAVRNNLRAYYVARPTKFVLYDQVNFPEHPQQEFVL